MSFHLYTAWVTGSWGSGNTYRNTVWKSGFQTWNENRDINRQSKTLKQNHNCLADFHSLLHKFERNLSLEINLLIHWHPSATCEGKTGLRRRYSQGLGRWGKKTVISCLSTRKLREGRQDLEPSLPSSSSRSMLTWRGNNFSSISVHSFSPHWFDLESKIISEMRSQLSFQMHQAPSALSHLARDAKLKLFKRVQTLHQKWGKH